MLFENWIKFRLPVLSMRDSICALVNSVLEFMLVFTSVFKFLGFCVDLYVKFNALIKN